MYVYFTTIDKRLLASSLCILLPPGPLSLSPFCIDPNIIHSGQPSLTPTLPELPTTESWGNSQAGGSSSSTGCEFHRGAVSPRPQGPRRCPPRAPAPGSYLHAGHRQRALQPVLPVLLGVRVKQHIAHLGRGDPVRRLLGPESPCWACLGASPSTSISHPQGPGEQGHSGLKQRALLHNFTQTWKSKCTYAHSKSGTGCRYEAYPTLPQTETTQTSISGCQDTATAVHSQLAATRQPAGRWTRA